MNDKDPCPMCGFRWDAHPINAKGEYECHEFPLLIVREGDDD